MLIWTQSTTANYSLMDFIEMMCEQLTYDVQSRLSWSSLRLIICCCFLQFASCSSLLARLLLARLLLARLLYLGWMSCKIVAQSVWNAHFCLVLLHTTISCLLFPVVIKCFEISFYKPQLITLIHVDNRITYYFVNVPFSIEQLDATFLRDFLLLQMVS